MKSFLFCLLLAFSSAAFATDYQKGQCPVAVNCALTGNPVNATTFSDTFTFIVDNWVEPSGSGTYDYVSSTTVVATGEHGSVACGRGCVPPPYDLRITGASIDGTPLVQIDAYHWSLPINLSPGTHVLAIQGTATGATWYARDGGGVEGITYTFVPAPPCTGDECGND